MRTFTRSEYTYLPTGTSYISEGYGPEYDNVGLGINFKDFEAGGPGVSKLGDPIGNYQTSGDGVLMLDVRPGRWSLSKSDTIHEGSVTKAAIQPLTPSLVIPSNEEALFVSYAMSQLYQEMTGPQSLVIIGEFDEAIQLIRNPFKQLLRLKDEIANIPRRYKGDDLRIAKALADVHLQWNFGIKPLLSDIRAGIKAYNKVLSKRRYFLFERALYKELSSSSSDFHQQVYSYGGNLSWDLVTQTTQRTVLEQKVKALYQHKRLGNKIPDPSTFGFGLESLLASSWELIPWSFVADYVTNIGQLIEAHSVVKTQLPYGTFSWVVRTESTQFYYLYQDVQGGSCVATPSRSYGQRFKRRSMREYDLPVLPTFTLGINTAQIRNLAALFIRKS